MTVEKGPSQERHVTVPGLDDLDVAATLAAADRAVVDRHDAEVRALLVDLHFAVLHSGPPEPQDGRSVRLNGRTKLVQLGGEGTPKVQDLPVCELAIARQVPVAAARRHLADALDLAHRLPRTWAQLRDGRGEVWVARRAAWTTRHLPFAAMPSVDAALAGAIDESAGRLLSILEAEVIRADPDGQQAKDAEARRHRCVAIGQSDEHGLRQIFGRIEAGDAAWLDAMLERVADALVARPDLIADLGDEPGRDELRAEALGWLAHPDAVVELLSGRYPPQAPSETEPATQAHQKAVVHVHLAADAVAGLLSQHGVARVEELGPMLAKQLARLLGHARVDLKPVIDLNTGRSVNGYEHPADVKERGFLRTCGDVFPHARTQSRRFDSDHASPYDEHGPPGQTGDHNHAPLGRTHHRAKTHLDYQVIQLGHAAYLWRTPHGLWRLVDGSGTHRITEDDAEALIADQAESVVRNSLDPHEGCRHQSSEESRVRVSEDRHPDDLSEQGANRASTTRDGFAVVGVAIRREPWIFTLSTIGSLLFGALTVADAWVLGWSTDHVLLPSLRAGHAQGHLLVAVLALFLGVALLRAVGIVARRLGAGIMQYRMQAHSRRAVTRQYLSLPMEWHQRHPTGELLSNANSDVEAAWGPIAPLPMAVGTVAMMVIAIVQMFAADMVLAVVGLLVFPAVIAANLAYQRLASPLMTRAQELRAEVSEIAHESFDGAMVVKTLGRETEETDRFAAKARELRDVNIRAGRIRAAFDPTLAALPNLGVLIVLAVGVDRVLHGATLPGDVVTVAYLLTIVSFPIRSIGWLLGEFPRSVVGFRRVSRVLEATGEIPYGEQRAVPRESAGDGAHLRVEHLAYSYVPGQPLLQDVTFEARPGHTVAVVGATASGKSTLTALLTRLVDPDRGRILLDGVDLRDLGRGELAGVVSLVPQTAFLFDDDVRGNVTLGSTVGGAEITDDEVWAALRAAQADGFVAALPHGLDTRLGERGTSLSGGQRQRISLARALVRRPRLLILDDATSAVDPEVEARILTALRTSSGGSTLVVVAYRKATIALADEVVHLEAGRIVDRGTHAELLVRSPGYARLVNAYEVGEVGELAGEGTR